MAPLEDRSQITVTTTAPEGATYEFLKDFTENIAYISDSIAADDKESMIMMVRSG